MHVLATPAFASAKSLEVSVRCEIERVGSPGRFLISRGNFTFVALDSQTRKPAAVPPVVPVTAIERHAFEKANQRYEARKASRKTAAAKSA